MLLTEEEAKTKWCPHARLGKDAGCNRHPNLNESLYDGDMACCIGSLCMAWRWHDENDHGFVIYTCEHGHGDNADSILLQGAQPYGAEWELIDSKPTRISHGIQQRRDTWRTPARGYCGAFGKPAA